MATEEQKRNQMIKDTYMQAGPVERESLFFLGMIRLADALQAIRCELSNIDYTLMAMGDDE